MIGCDSATSPYGGGAWASRGIVCGGEAALKAADALAENIKRIAAAITQSDPRHLELNRSGVRNIQTGSTLADVARIGYFRQATLPPDVDVQLMVTRCHAVNDLTYYITNGVQASYLEVDTRTGFVSLLGHWAVTDCGKVINPFLAEEQIRGGIVQGIGSALYEECIYDSHGNMTNGTLADYLVPMAFEMPAIKVEFIGEPESTTMLGATGVGEAGLIGAMGAVWVAVTDALRPLGARITEQPFTPERVLRALAQAQQTKASSSAGPDIP